MSADKKPQAQLTPAPFQLLSLGDVEAAGFCEGDVCMAPAQTSGLKPKEPAESGDLSGASASQQAKSDSTEKQTEH